MKTWNVLAALLIIASNANPQLTLGAYFDGDVSDPTNPLETGGVHVVEGQQFELVIVLDNIPPGFNAFEYKHTELSVIAPGVFNLNYAGWCGGADLGDVPGEHICGIGFCNWIDTRIEIERITYGVYGGAMTDNTVVQLTGTSPSSFGPTADQHDYSNPPGISICGGELVPASMATPGFWVMSDPPTWVPPGGLVINPTDAIVATDQTTFSQLKARF